MTDNKTTHDRIRIRLSKPGDLLASLPQMMGFRPVNSVVLLADTGAGGKEIGRRVRCDLPPDEHAAALAEQLVESITKDDPTSVVVVIIGAGQKEPADHDSLPHLALVAAIRTELDGRGVDQPAAFWVPEIREGVRWACYDHESCGGKLPDPRSTLAAAASVSLGMITYGSREELAELLTPDRDLLLRGRAQLIDAKVRDLGFGTAPEWSEARGFAAVRAALRASLSGLLALSDDQIAEVGLALADVRVRDACLATALPPDSDVALAAARLWQALSRALPAPERAEAACLAGYAAYMAGNGTLAGIALEAAHQADRDHILSGLLMSALQNGLAPEVLHGLGRTEGPALWPVAGEDLERQVDAELDGPAREQTA